jgi:hypothetical protein
VIAFDLPLSREQWRRRVVATADAGAGYGESARDVLPPLGGVGGGGTTECPDETGEDDEDRLRVYDHDRPVEVASASVTLLVAPASSSLLETSNNAFQPAG